MSGEQPLEFRELVYAKRGYLTSREAKCFWLGFAMAFIGCVCGVVFGLLVF